MATTTKYSKILYNCVFSLTKELKIHCPIRSSIIAIKVESIPDLLRALSEKALY